MTKKHTCDSYRYSFTSRTQNPLRALRQTHIHITGISTTMLVTLTNHCGISAHICWWWWYLRLSLWSTSGNLRQWKNYSLEGREGKLTSVDTSTTGSAEQIRNRLTRNYSAARQVQHHRTPISHNDTINGENHVTWNRHMLAKRECKKFDRSKKCRLPMLSVISIIDGHQWNLKILK